MYSIVIKVWRKLKVKVSSSCTEDLELVEKESKHHMSKLILFCQDHQTSVIFAKDLKKRIEETSAVNPVESLNILLEGRLRMKKYSEEEKDSCKVDSQDLALNNAYTSQDTYSNRKLPQENPEQETLNQTENILHGKDKGNSTESMCDSLNYAEDGCDNKSENKESKNNTKCVKSSECSKETRGTSGTLRTSAKSNSSSSFGSGDGDDDDNDRDRNRRKVQEKFDGGDLISIKDEEKSVKDEEESVKDGHASVKDEWALVKDEEASVNDEEMASVNDDRGASVNDDMASVSVKDASIKEEEASVMDVEASVKNEMASVKDDKTSVKNEDASMKNEDASVKNEDASVKNEDASVKDEDSTIKDSTVRDEDSTVKDEDSTVKEEKASVKNEEASVKNEEASVKNGEASVKDEEASVKDEEASVKDEEASFKDGEASVKDGEASVKDEEASVKDEEKRMRRRKSSSLDFITSNKMTENSSNNLTEVINGSISLSAAFKCYGEKSCSFDRCKSSKCYRSHHQLEHSRRCKFRVLGGCKKCTELRDIYLYHTSHCNDDKCTISRCWVIKKYLKETPSHCPARWSYHADNIFFEERFTDPSSWDIPQDEFQKKVTPEEIKELLQSLQTPQSSIISTENYYSCIETSSNNFVRGRPGASQTAYMCPPTRPPDDRDLSLNVPGSQSKAPISGTSFSITDIDEDKASEDVIHSRGVMHIDMSLTYCQRGTDHEEDIYLQEVVPDERAIPRPENIELLHSFDESSLTIKDGHYDEGHEWRIVQVNNFLGRGGYGECRLCTDLTSNKLFAIKKIKKEMFDYDELKIWASVSSKGVRCLDLFGAVCVKKDIIIFMEYMEGGSVENMLNNLPENRFDENTALYITREVLEGCDFLHCRNIIHRDIKGANILVNETLTKVKLADFGAAVQLGKQEFFKRENRPPGTENFMSPEVCRSEEHSFSADIWSIGCSLYQMLKGKPPWTEFASVIYKVGTTKEPPEFPDCSKETKNLLSKMFALVPKNRPTAKELLRYPAIGKVNEPPETPCVADDDECERESEDSNIEDIQSSCDDEFFSFEASSSSNNDEYGNELFGTPEQTPLPAEDDEKCLLGGTNHSIGSLHQTYPSTEEDELAMGGTYHTIGSLHQTNPSTEDQLAAGGTYQILPITKDECGDALGGPSQTYLPVGNNSSLAIGGAGFFWGSARQRHPSVEDDGRRALGKSGQTFGSLYRTLPPSEDDNCRLVLEGPDQPGGLSNQLTPSTRSVNDNQTIPVDDDLQRLRSEFVRMVSLSGGDVSNLVGMIGNADTVEDPDDVFDETGFFKSITEPVEESDEPTHSPGSPYSMKDLTKVDLYYEDGLLLFTVREKSSCTFGNLAENIHSKIMEKTPFLRCFTFKTKEGGAIDPSQELGFLDHMIKVLPAGESDQWSKWRVDERGIVELKAYSDEVGVSRPF